MLAEAHPLRRNIDTTYIYNIGYMVLQGVGMERLRVVEAQNLQISL